MKKRPDAALLKHYRFAYRRGDRKKKKSLLNHVCEIHGYHRKAATRLLNRREPDRYGCDNGSEFLNHHVVSFLRYC